jgi:hypothetical protein
MKPLSKQEIFNKIWNRFVTLKKPLSFERLKPSNFIYCKMYGANGAMDPMGMFIPKEVYDPWMEEAGGHTVKSFLLELKNRNLLEQDWTNIFVNNQKLFEDLQEAHDDVAKFVKPRRRLGAIAGRLRGVAKKHRLEIP